MTTKRIYLTRAAAGVALASAMLAGAALNPTGPTGANSSTTTTTRCTEDMACWDCEMGNFRCSPLEPEHATIPTLPSPAAIEIPLELAQAIGEARARTEPTCVARDQGHAQAWAEIDEGGTVQGIDSSCVAGGS